MTRNKTGLTLVEVVASLALASLAIVMILNAVTSHQRQLKRVALKKEATLLLESLLADWFESDEPLPVGQSGELSEDNQYFWKVESQGSVNSTWKVRVIRVSILRNDDPSDRIVSVELLDRVRDSNGVRKSSRSDGEP